MNGGFLKFGKNAAPIDNETKEALPVNGTPFTVDILEVSPSRLNPRLTHGLNYQDHYNNLKTSIRNIGLQTTLTVTKYADSEHYELYNGGNTRLKILTELYHEYDTQGDTQQANHYRYQQVNYVAFTNELDVLVKHMVENEERINMTFIDKARAIFQIKALYLAQNDTDKISNRQLTELITQLGWSSVKHQAMTELSFAFEKLDHVIPLALNSGMGRPKIQQLRLWLNSVKKYVTWLCENKASTLTIDEAERLYFKTLAQFDDDIEPMNLSNFHQTFVHKLADHLQAIDKQLTADTVQLVLETIEKTGAVPKHVNLANETVTSVASQPEPANTHHHGTPTTTPESAPTETVAQQTGADATATHIDRPQEPIPSPATTGHQPKPPPTKPTPNIIEQLLAQSQNKKLQQVIQFTHAKQPPFFKVNADLAEHSLILENVIKHGQLAEKYVVLHLLAVYALYDDKAPSNNLWQAHLSRYVQLQGLCQTGLILHNDKQAQAMQVVHQLCQQHFALCNAIESSTGETHAKH